MAVLWVIAFHYVVVRAAAGVADPWLEALRAVPPLEVIVKNGYLGVDLFFAITGFLLVLPWLRHAEAGLPAPGARPFYRRRFERIVPAYWVQLGFLFFLFVPLLRGIEWWRWDFWFLLYNLGAHATFLHYTTPLSSASLQINGALWTLALEMQWYLLLPLVAPLFARRPWATSAALVTLAIGWRWLAAHDLDALVRFDMAIAARWKVPEDAIRHLLATQLPGYFAHFAAGMLCGWAWLRWRGRHASTVLGAASLAVAAAALAALYAIYRPSAAHPFGPYGWLATAILIGLAMAALVSRGTPATHALLANRPIAWAGRVSYSAYLYHLPLLLTWNEYAPRMGWMAFPAYLASVAAVAWLSYRYVELPFLRQRSVARAGADGERGEDRERLQRGDSPEHVQVAARVHHRPEDQRRDGEPRVDA